MKLKNFMLGTLLVFSLLPLIIYGAFSIYETNEKIDSMLKLNIEAISENQIANIQSFAMDRKLQMEKIASYQMTRDAIAEYMGNSNAEADRQYLDNILKEQKKYGTYVASVSVVSKDYHVVASSEDYDLYELSQMKNVNEKFQTGEFIIGNVYERRTDDGLKKVVPAYIGVYDKGELIGYISEELDTAYFDNLRLNMDMVSKGTFYLLDGNLGIITAGNNSSQNSLSGFVTDKSERSEFQEKWEQIDFEKNPSGELTYHYGRDEYITYYSSVENTEWSIRISENMTAQKADMKSRNVLLVLVLVLLAAAVVIVQVFMTNRILQPIQEAIKTFRRIEETKDYSLRMSKQSNYEMKELMGGVNELLSYIEREKIYERIMERSLRQQAESDSLTGVKNKKAIEQYVMDMVNLSAEKDSQITMGFVDIDDFRHYNTVYGHQQADEVICLVAKALSDNIKGEVGRIGGDEFLFCYTGCFDEETIKENVENILKLLEVGIDVSETGKHISVTCSIGIVTAKGKELDYMHLIRMADQAMYEAKDNGKNSVVVRNCAETQE